MRAVIDTPERYADEWIDLRLGRWQDVLADVLQADAVISDPPYSERVVLGFRSGSDPTLKRGVYNIPYAAWTQHDAQEFTLWASTIARRWAVVFNDHVGARWLEEAFAGRGFYTYAPVPWCRTDPPPRMNGDGPCSATEYITVARPRGKQPSERMRSRPGYYIHAGTSSARHGDKPIVTGQKPLPLMKRLVRDYTEPGDLIVDPFGGGFTTALACAVEGRRCISSETDPDTFRNAVNRIKSGYTPVMRLPPRPKAKQEPLL